MVDAGNECELIVYEGVGHLFTPSTEPDNEMPNPDPKVAADSHLQIRRFLTSHGYITVDE
jgi:hypothetical protein